MVDIFFSPNDTLNDKYEDDYYRCIPISYTAKSFHMILLLTIYNYFRLNSVTSKIQRMFLHIRHA